MFCQQHLLLELATLSVFSPSLQSSWGWSLTWWFLGGAENRELSQGAGLSAKISGGVSAFPAWNNHGFGRKGMAKRHWSLLVLAGFHHLDVWVWFKSSWNIWMKKNDDLRWCLVMSEQGIDMFSAKWGADKQLARSDLGLKGDLGTFNDTNVWPFCDVRSDDGFLPTWSQVYR